MQVPHKAFLHSVRVLQDVTHCRVTTATLASVSLGMVAHDMVMC